MKFKHSNIFSGLGLFREPHYSNREVTVKDQEEYQKNLVEQARMGRIAMPVVCLVNMLVSLLIPLGGFLLLISVISLILSIKGKSLCLYLIGFINFILIEAASSFIFMLSFTGIPPEMQGVDLYFLMLATFGTVNCVYLIQSKTIGSWFEYAHSYKHLYLGLKPFEY